MQRIKQQINNFAGIIYRFYFALSASAIIALPSKSISDCLI